MINSIESDVLMLNQYISTSSHVNKELAEVG